MADTSAITRKLGPLPVWAWGILGGIAVYFLYVRYKGGSSTTGGATGPVATVLDPNAVDPTTGLTYGQEMGGSFPVTSPGFGGATGSGTGATAPGGTDFVTGFDSGQAAFVDALNAWQQLTGGLGQQPPNPSDATLDAAASPALKNTNRPPTKPSAHRKQKTIHVAHPGPHQHPIHPRKSNAHPAPVRHPASGGHPGHVRSGSHAKPHAPKSRPSKPVVRTRAPVTHPPKPKPQRRRRR